MIKNQIGLNPVYLEEYIYTNIYMYVYIYLINNL